MPKLQPYYTTIKKEEGQALPLLNNLATLSYDAKSSLIRTQRGFTIVELLIVIVIIGILAAISIVAYNTVQEKARTAKIQQDISQLIKAVTIARNNTGKTLFSITGSYSTYYTCAQKAVGTDLAALPATDSCWTNYIQTLNRISDASGVDVRGIKDPWNRPYSIDENEGENGNCNRDFVAVFAVPFNQGSGRTNNTLIPFSGNSGCAL